VRDDELGLGEQRPERRRYLTQVRALLGRGSPLAGPHERVPAERDDGCHRDVALRLSRLCWLSRLRR
jgi:hypothetical protein